MNKWRAVEITQSYEGHGEPCSFNLERAGYIERIVYDTDPQDEGVLFNVEGVQDGDWYLDDKFKMIKEELRGELGWIIVVQPHPDHETNKLVDTSIEKTTLVNLCFVTALLTSDIEGCDEIRFATTSIYFQGNVDCLSNKIRKNLPL